MKKKLITSIAVLIALGMLCFWAYNYLTDLLVAKTLDIVSNDPVIKEELDAVISQTLTEEPEAEPEKEEETEKPKPEKEKPSSTPSKNCGLSMDSLQGSDKDYVMSIYKRFTASEVSRVTGMLSGGITAEEKQIIKSIVYAKVSSAEVSKLLNIAKKYQ